jgi:hypothetical protein
MSFSQMFEVSASLSKVDIYNWSANSSDTDTGEDLLKLSSLMQVQPIKFFTRGFHTINFNLLAGVKTWFSIPKLMFWLLFEFQILTGSLSFQIILFELILR